MPRKPVQPSLTAVKQVLQSCAFNPRVSGPLKIIADVGDQKYYKTRAIELIADGDLKRAIGLLALAMIYGQAKDTGKEST